MPTIYLKGMLVADYPFDDGSPNDDTGDGLDDAKDGATATTSRDGSGALASDVDDDF